MFYSVYIYLDEMFESIQSFCIKGVVLIAELFKNNFINIFYDLDFTQSFLSFEVE